MKTMGMEGMYLSSVHSAWRWRTGMWLVKGGVAITAASGRRVAGPWPEKEQRAWVQG